jgi:hypothetical protein
MRYFQHTGKTALKGGRSAAEARKWFGIANRSGTTPNMVIAAGLARGNIIVYDDFVKSQNLSYADLADKPAASASRKHPEIFRKKSRETASKRSSSFNAWKLSVIKHIQLNSGD